MKLALLVVFAALTFAASAEWTRDDVSNYWKIDELTKMPAVRDNPFADSEYPGLKAMLVTGKGPKDGVAEFFAYYACPTGVVPQGGFPGVLLVHGGGGTAFPNYVSLWVKKGFAVLALDWYNRRPIFPKGPEAVGESKTERADLPGGTRNDIQANVANMVLAHTVLRSRPEVDASRTVFVGLSWGSWYGGIVSALDSRFKGVVEIYCGDVKRGDTRLINGRFLHAAKCPMWWFVSTNDRNVTPESSAEGWRECAALVGKTIVNDLPHSHVGFTFEGCARMARHFALGEPALPVLSAPTVSDGVIAARILGAGKGVDHAKVAWTDSSDDTTWKRKWKYAAAEIDGDRIRAKIPEGAVQVYLAAYEKNEGRHRELCGTTTFVNVK